MSWTANQNREYIIHITTKEKNRIIDRQPSAVAIYMLFEKPNSGKVTLYSKRYVLLWTFKKAN